MDKIVSFSTGSCQHVLLSCPMRGLRTQFLILRTLRAHECQATVEPIMLQGRFESRPLLRSRKSPRRQSPILVKYLHRKIGLTWFKSMQCSRMFRSFLLGSHSNNPISSSKSRHLLPSYSCISENSTSSRSVSFLKRRLKNISFHYVIIPIVLLSKVCWHRSRCI